MIKNFKDEYERYKLSGWKAIEQVSDEAMNKVLGPNNNSIAMLVRHITGNLISRFTDFLTSDGEKLWRNRDSEFEETAYDRKQVEKMWAEGWGALESQLSNLKDGDIDKKVVIRGQELSVHEALARSLAHTAYHIGQIVLLARILTDDEWKWITIPKGGSDKYNKNPNMEKKPV